MAETGNHGMVESLAAETLAKMPEDRIEKVAENASGEFTKAEQHAAKRILKQK